MNSKPETVEEYLASIPDEARATLERLRSQVKRIQPEVIDVLSYGMPALKFKGKLLVYYAAFKQHLSLFPGSSSVIDQLADDLKDLKTSKGTIQFTSGNPLPEIVVRKIVEVRVREILAGKADRKRKAP